MATQVSAASEAVQDYLKTIYVLAEDGSVATTGEIADRLRVSPASVSAMVRRLAGRGLVRHERHRGVTLTPEGETAALDVIRHHRLLETYLHEALGVPWDEVHAEAEVLEHAISDRLIERIAAALGNPTHDPHGDPIPPRRGKHVERAFTGLNEAGPGRVRVERVSDRDPDALRYLGDLGIVPGVALDVVEQAPFGGPVWVRAGRRKHALGRRLAAAVKVSTVDGGGRR
ncbi:MAG TPA: metal-dependent transcriptional regulator [Actinomycetota bacterium]|nr:metal-dependent transcriptional regulator [Actinomycetota bacterium]